MGAQSRLFFAAQPDQRTSSSLQVGFAYELAELSDDERFYPGNWHQSLSDVCFNMSMLETYLRAGALIQATAVRMLFNRVRSNGDHWSILTKGTPEGFHALLAAVRAALKQVGIIELAGHTPHITISYRTSVELVPQPKIDPIEWMIDDVLLLEGGGHPYRYKVRGRWPLVRAINPQPSLWD